MVSDSLPASVSSFSSSISFVMSLTVSLSWFSNSGGEPSGVYGTEYVVVLPSDSSTDDSSCSFVLCLFVLLFVFVLFVLYLFEFAQFVFLFCLLGQVL